MPDTNIISAFVAGIISFFSPCVLPLLPGFLIHISNTGLAEGKNASKLRVFLNAICYVFGFSVVFATLGILFNAFIPHNSYIVQTWLSIIGGTIIIFFGLFATGIIKAHWLQKSHQLFRPKKTSVSYISSFIFGAAFAVGWTPCVGAILGAVLTLAISQPSIAFGLLLSYSLGIGIPFLILGAFASQAVPLLRKLGPHLETVQKIAGVILIIFGILVATQRLPLLAGYLSLWI